VRIQMSSGSHAESKVGIPSAWVIRFTPLIVEGGKVLDVACGTGRHARLLASMGYRVEAADRDSQALAVLEGEAGIRTRRADLECDEWPYEPASFDAVIVTNYLHRPRFPMLIDALQPGGILICETFMIGNEALGRPSNPAFLLLPGELFDRVRERLTVVAFEQGRVELPKPAVVQRICAVAASAGQLPT
jgi:SAM-dependent methyltransferase